MEKISVVNQFVIIVILLLIYREFLTTRKIIKKRKEDKVISHKPLPNVTSSVHVTGLKQPSNEEPLTKSNVDKKQETKEKIITQNDVRWLLDNDKVSEDDHLDILKMLDYKNTNGAALPEHKTRLKGYYELYTQMESKN